MINKKKPKSVRAISGILPRDSEIVSTCLNMKVGPTSITRGLSNYVDKITKDNPGILDDVLKEVQWCEDNSRRVGRKVEFTSNESEEKANNMLEIIRNMSRNDLSAFKSLISNDEDFKTCTITRIKN